MHYTATDNKDRFDCRKDWNEKLKKKLLKSFSTLKNGISYDLKAIVEQNRTESTQQSEPKFLTSENCLSDRDTQKHVMKNPSIWTIVP